MLNDVKKMIQKELPRGAATLGIKNRDEMLSTLEKDRITADMDLKPIEFLFEIKGKKCFPRGELSTISGKAKTGKTFLTSMLMAACTADSVLDIKRVEGLPPLKCMWYDTEQSKQSTCEILKDRIVPLAKDNFAEELYDVFNVRSQDWEQRLDLLGVAIDEFRPDLVLVDNICDLIRDINDVPGNKAFMEKMMEMAQKYNCSIVCVIHQNKGAEDRNPRGSIGTELLHKSFEVYTCDLYLPQVIFGVEQTLSRKYRMSEIFFFEVNEQGLPIPSDGPQTSATTTEGSKNPPMNPEYTYWENDTMQVKIRQLFYDILKTGPRYYNDLQKKTMEVLGCKETGYWNKLFNQAKNDGVIINTRNKEYKSVWALPTKPASQGPDIFEQAAAGEGCPY